MSCLLVLGPGGPADPPDAGRRRSGVPLRLLLDRTEVEGRFNLLVVAVAFRRRAFPLLWVELGHAGCCSFREQRLLLGRVRAWIPEGARVIVIGVGDREFRSTQLARWIVRQGWEFVLRLKCDTRVEVRPGRWVRLDELGWDFSRESAAG